ncbi:MAG: adenylate/guanylate cyclase domain-containing protein [Ignavibacteriae bacterium]|nr:adenylate/guanylate cyclase domain-containing protein [Ignavibacteriota bacterium]
MKKRYYISMLSLFLLILFFDALYIPAHKTITIFLILGLLHLVLFVPLNFSGAHFLYRPIDNAFKENRLNAEVIHRISRLPWYSSIWIFILGLAYFILMLVMFFFFPVDTGNVTLEEMPASIWLTAIPSMIYIYAILPAFITWFLINDYCLDLKTRMLSKFNLVYPPGNKKYGLTLLITFVILGFLPSILVTLEIIASGAGNKYGQFSDMTPLEGLLPDRIAVFTGIVIAVIFIARSFTKPVYSLLKGIEKVKEGDYSTFIPVITEDEIGKLTNEFNTMVKGLKEREIIRDTFGKYVTKDVANVILDKKINTAGEERICTILVTDIANYTTITEASSPNEIVKMLNEYFTELVGIINKYKGVVNEFVGDSVFSMFNVPLDDPDHAIHAIKAGLKIEEITNIRTFGNGRKLSTRIGINTGLVVAGNVGAEDRLKYSVVGDDVNIAARLEQLNKQYGTQLLVGGNTYELAKDNFSFFKLGDFHLKGKEKSVKVYRINK